MVTIRTATLDDAQAINDIGNHYIHETPANFKTEALTVGERKNWIAGFAATGRSRLLVASTNDHVIGYAGSSPFHERKAFETSVSTAIYLHPDNHLKGVGTLLYTELFRQLKTEDIHRIFAGITLPNPASRALHKKFEFKEVGTFTEAGRKFGQYWDVMWLEKSI